MTERSTGQPLWKSATDSPRETQYGSGACLLPTNESHHAFLFAHTRQHHHNDRYYYNFNKSFIYLHSYSQITISSLFSFYHARQNTTTRCTSSARLITPAACGRARDGTSSCRRWGESGGWSVCCYLSFVILLLRCKWFAYCVNHVIALFDIVV